MIEKLMMNTYGEEGILILIALSSLFCWGLGSYWWWLDNKLSYSEDASAIDRMFVWGVFFLAFLSALTRMHDYWSLILQ